MYSNKVIGYLALLALGVNANKYKKVINGTELECELSEVKFNTTLPEQNEPYQIEHCIKWVENPKCPSPGGIPNKHVGSVPSETPSSSKEPNENDKEHKVIIAPEGVTQGDKDDETSTKEPKTKDPLDEVHESNDGQMPCPDGQVAVPLKEEESNNVHQPGDTAIKSPSDKDQSNIPIPNNGATDTKPVQKNPETISPFGYLGKVPVYDSNDGEMLCTDGQKAVELTKEEMEKVKSQPSEEQSTIVDPSKVLPSNNLIQNVKDQKTGKEKIIKKEDASTKVVDPIKDNQYESPSNGFKPEKTSPEVKKSNRTPIGKFEKEPVYEAAEGESDLCLDGYEPEYLKDDQVKSILKS